MAQLSRVSPLRGRGRPPFRFVSVGLLLLAALALAGCTGGTSRTSKPATVIPSVAGASPATTVISAATAIPSVTTPTATPPAAAVPSVTPPAAGAATTATSAATPGTAAAQAVMAVIQRANAEQLQALARHDPTLMRDTATVDYYAVLVQGQRDMETGGVTAIQLLTLQWGPVSVQGTRAQATTVETWQTTFADSSSQQSSDRNVYALVQQSGGWLIASDAHPDSHLNQPGPGASPGASAPTPPSGAAGAGSGASQSRNWAGYAASGGPFTAVSGSWTIPQVNASGTVGGADATWVGIGGVVTHDLIQAGTDATVVGPGQVVYSAWVELLPDPSQTVPLVVNPGEVINVSITQQAGVTWQISIVNQTTTQRYQTTVQYQSSRSSVEWIEEAPAAGGVHIVTLDSFGSVQVKSGSAIENGQQVTIAQAGGQPITMYGRTGQPIAGTSALGPDSASFTVIRLGGG